MMRAPVPAAFLIAFLSAAHGAAAQDAIIDTIAGGGPTGLLSTEPRVWATSMIEGPAGEIYVGARVGFTFSGQVYRVDPSGVISVLAGTDLYVPITEGGPATESGFGLIVEMAVDAAGNLYFSEYGMAVRRVDAASGTISTVAGGGTMSVDLDGIPATESSLGYPYGLAFDAAGNLYVSAEAASRVRRVDAVTGIITTVAGDGNDGFTGDGGPATSAALNRPRGIAFDAAGNLYIADSANSRIRKVDAATGLISTVAGSGAQGFGGDGGPAVSAQLNNPSGLAADGAGNVYLTDWMDTGDGPSFGRIRRIDAATGIITLAAGGGTGGLADGLPATMATMADPQTVHLASNGDILLADPGNEIAGAPYDSRGRRVEHSTGLIYSLVDGSAGALGDGGPATDAILDSVLDVARGAGGDLFLSTSDMVVRRIDASTGIITHYAGDNACGFFCGDGGPATLAGLRNVQGIDLDATGNLFIADAGNARVRLVDAATGIITTYAGDGTQGYGGDNRKATQASLNNPTDVAVDAAGVLYIADRDNHRIRVVIPQGQKIDTFAGNGTQGYGGDGGPATSAALDHPSDVALDPAGRLLIVDAGNFRIRGVDLATGIITTVAGDGTPGYGGDGGPATLAQIGAAGDVAVDEDGGILLTDGTNRRVRRVDPVTGNIDTVAGNGIPGHGGDGGLATLASLDGGTGIAAEPNGGFVFGSGTRIRRVSATSLATAAGEVPDGDMAGESPLVVTHAPFGQITLQWGASCSADDIDYEVYEGSLGSFTSHAPFVCGTGGATTVTWTPPAGDLYFLVVSRSFAREGSYGRDSLGVERPAAAQACIPQEIGACQ